MRQRKLVASAIVLLLCALMAGKIWRDKPPTSVVPLVVSVHDIEPANIIDDAGEGMLLVKLAMTNSCPWPNQPVYVKDLGISFEAKVANRWIAVEGRIGDCALRPFDSHRIDVVVPASASACRIAFKWTFARLTGGQLRWIAENYRGWLPTGTRAQLWRLGWGGFPRFRPGSHWREITIETILPQSGSRD